MLVPTLLSRAKRGNLRFDERRQSPCVIEKETKELKDSSINLRPS